ncbi:11705_t:CDS:2 [Funneliformis caledonium]|uniref:11705_t:CDS:1 n=1 Tax=Funneliformis caledonium TaxID=1117310 RepID=A0A9N9FQT8_9GLOM|nr:11705_t:CDS:2 [Funneliformis caledonium]
MLPAAVSNALIYVVLVIFLGIGTFAGYKKTKTKTDYLSSLGTQNAVALAANWFASIPRNLFGSWKRKLRKDWAEKVPLIPDQVNACVGKLPPKMFFFSIGSSILYAYPEVGTMAGLLGVFMYAIGSVVPLFVFAWLGPLIREKSPEGFTLTQFTLERFGRINQIYISLMSMAYMFSYMISELSAVGNIINLLTGLEKYAPVIMIAIITTIYTGYGGLRASLITDHIQGWAIIILVVLSTIGLGTSVKIEKSVIDSSPLLKSNSLGWQLLYIMTVALAFSTLFHEGFWQRTFSSKNNRELRLSAIYGSIMLFPVLVLIGFTGILAAWSGLWPGEENLEGYLAFFALFKALPDWVSGIILVLTVSMSCAAYDTLISATTAIISNDLFRNRLPLNVIRGLSLVANIPAVVLGLKDLDVLRVFLIGDLLAAAAMPPILLGLCDQFYFINGIDALVGGIGGLFGVFAFGSILYNSAKMGFELLGLPSLYNNDYSVLGAFVAAPLASIFFTFLSFGVRLGVLWLYAKVKGDIFEFPKFTDTSKERKQAEDESNVQDSEKRNPEFTDGQRV